MPLYRAVRKGNFSFKRNCSVIICIEGTNIDFCVCRQHKSNIEDILKCVTVWLIFGEIGDNESDYFITCCDSVL